MAAKEKGKIVSASPDSPTLEKLSTFSQQIRSALHCFSAVATRTNALWQRKLNLLSIRSNQSQPARMRCGKVSGPCRRSQKSPVATRANALWQRWVAIQIFSVVTSQPARMRCGKVAPLLCPNRKLREHELRSSFLVSPPVILVVTFYMTTQLLKRFNTCTAKTAASKLSDAAVYSFNK